MSKDQSSDHGAQYEQGPELRSQSGKYEQGHRLRIWFKVKVHGSCLSLATNQSRTVSSLLPTHPKPKPQLKEVERKFERMVKRAQRAAKSGGSVDQAAGLAC